MIRGEMCRPLARNWRAGLGIFSGCSAAFDRLDFTLLPPEPRQQ
jgi:hypothetical protein